MKKRKVYVYLAGKVTKNGWREEIAAGWREAGAHAYAREEPSTAEMLMTEVKHGNGIVLVGPFFISCDHGCYHGDNEHGVGAATGGCAGELITQSDVEHYCRCCIQYNAQVVFAYIDSPDCYGTIYELGMAAEMGKRYAILYANEELRDNMWFINQEAALVQVRDKDLTLKEQFENIIEEIRL